MLTTDAIFFIENTLQSKIISVEAIQNSGSNRQYYRIFTNNKSYIFTNSLNIDENLSFVYFSNLFKTNNFLVPKVIAIDANNQFYLQEDIGNVALLDVLKHQNYDENTFELYQKSLKNLAQIQIQLKNKIDYNNCYDFQIFDEKVVWNDLFYFKNYFLDKLDIPYKKADLIAEFVQISEKVKKFKMNYFLYRDFQARNIFINENNPYFIDFQGGMQGFIGYDLVSLLWQAKANLPMNWKTALKDYYFDFFANEMTKEELSIQYEISLIIRFYQILGAYGLRGLVEQKTHFLESILHHLDNLDYLLEKKLLSEYPELQRITAFFVSENGKTLIKNHIKI